MIRRYRKSLIVLVVVALAGFVIFDISQQPGPADLKGSFEELAFVRNEQNKGGIVRIYAYRVTDTVDADYLGCGELLPHNDYGSSTKVFFFVAGKPAPQALRLDPPHFDTLRFRPVAIYHKNSDGEANVTRLGFPNQRPTAPR